jgi:hypothetical protein
MLILQFLVTFTSPITMSQPRRIGLSISRPANDDLIILEAKEGQTN